MSPRRFAGISDALGSDEHALMYGLVESTENATSAAYAFCESVPSIVGEFGPVPAAPAGPWQFASAHFHTPPGWIFGKMSVAQLTVQVPPSCVDWPLESHGAGAPGVVAVAVASPGTGGTFRFASPLGPPKRVSSSLPHADCANGRSAQRKSDAVKSRERMLPF